ncbi:ubiquitin binding protein [Hymenopellis radicata]|nr:ubiquitin binding protein [Hymenopellis radicata]
MSTLSSWLWGTTMLDEAIEKATSELLPTGADDMALNLEICDQIRSKSVPAKDAMKALKRRLNHKNPNVQLLALTLTDVCIKNGGDHFLVEVASRDDVKLTMLRLIQNWSIAFEGNPSLSYVVTTYNTLVREGFNFPPKDLTVSTSVMVDTKTAPEWIDSELCMRCRDSFTFTNRKHHCRNCGLVFDQKCSSKSIPLPHFGLTQEVRVCDGCYNKLSKRAEQAKLSHRHSASLPVNRHRHHRQDIDTDLQRAIQLSLQESSGYSPSPALSSSVPNQYFSEPPLVDRSTRPEEDDPDLKAAIEASLREAAAPRPSAPLDVSTSTSAGMQLPNYDLEPLESDVILTFSQEVDQVHRQGSGLKGREVSELYDKANSLRPKLAMSLDDAGRKEQLLTDMHGKLSEAVKLYDQLLTEQLAHPRWRQSQYQPQPQISYQAQTPVQASYTPLAQPYAPPQEYQSPTQTSYQQPYTTSYATPTQPMYNPSYVASPTAEQGQMVQQSASASAPPVSISSPPPVPHPSHAQYSPSAPIPVSQPQYSAPAPSVPPPENAPVLAYQPPLHSPPQQANLSGTTRIHRHSRIHLLLPSNPSHTRRLLKLIRHHHNRCTPRRPPYLLSPSHQTFRWHPHRRHGESQRGRKRC